jgi:hypothetical protein
VTAARLDRVEGEVYVTTRSGRKAAAAGQDILAGEGIACAGAHGFAVLTFPDKSRLELSCGASVRDLHDVDPAAKRGKRVFSKGDQADPSAAEKDRPLMVWLSAGQLKVVGTTFG